MTALGHSKENHLNDFPFNEKPQYKNWNRMAALGHSTENNFPFKKNNNIRMVKEWQPSATSQKIT